VSLAYSLDGVFLVSGSSDKSIKLWDVQTGGVIKTFCSHTGQVYSVSISADNTTIASASEGGVLCLWNIKTGNCCTIERYRDYANTITFSPTNSQLLSSSGDGDVQQWDINGFKIGSPVPGYNVAFSLDGTQFVSWTEETVTIRNTDSKMTTADFNLDSEPSYCCFSPNGRFIAVAADHAIYLWDITGPEPCLIQTFIGHSNTVISLVFSSPYSLTSASRDKSIKIWQIDTSPADPGALSTEPTPFTSVPIRSVSLQARDSLAFSIDSTGVVKIWDILTGCCKKFYQTQIERIHCADIQLVNERLIIVWKEVLEKRINVWNAKQGKLQTISVPTGYTYGLRMIGDGSRVLQLCSDSIWAWDIWTGESVGEERLKRDDTCFVNFQRGSSEGFTLFDTLRIDGSKVLVCFGESSVQGWDFGTPGSTPIQFSETSSDRPHLNFIDVREWSDKSPVRIEGAITGKEVFQLCGRYANPVAIQWDGQHLIAGYESGRY